MIHGRSSVVLSVVCIVIIATFVPIASVGATDPIPGVDPSDSTSRMAGLKAPATESGAPIAPALNQENGTVEVIVELEPANTAMNTDYESTRTTLRRHATETQRPVVEFARSHPKSVTVERRLWLSNIVLLSVDTERVELDRIATVEGVERLSPNERLQSPRPQPATASPPAVNASSSRGYNTTFGVDQVNAPAVWSEYDTRGEDVSVAVLDSGVSIDHPDIELHTADATDPTYPGGWAEFTQSGGRVADSQPRAVCGDHGTHTSGTVAGSNASGEWIGVAPNAELMHGAVLTESTGFGCGGSTVQVIAGMQWAVNNSADVISMSLGGSADGELIDPVRNAEAAGTVVVAASGNGGPGTAGSPGSVYETIAVGSTAEDRSVAGSSGGKTVEANTTFPHAPEGWPATYVVPDVVAPGVGVKSAVPNGSYTTHSGTSMATPHVAGVIALMLSSDTDDSTPAAVKRALYSTATKPKDCSPDCSPRDGNDTRYGAGIIDAYGAVSALDPVPTHQIGDVDEDGSLSVNDIQLLQQYLADSLSEDAHFNEQLADLDRDGKITHRDLRLLQRSVLGDLSAGRVNLSALDSPDSVSHGESISVSVTATNTGGRGVIEELSYRFGSASDLGQNDTVASEVVDLGPGESTTVTFEFTPDALPGQYHHAVVSKTDAAGDQLTVRGGAFTIRSVATPPSIATGETLTSNVTVENTGNENATHTVESALESVGTNQRNITLDAGDRTTVTFSHQIPPTKQSAEIEQVVTTPADQATQSVRIDSPFFRVGALSGPSSVTPGEPVTVSTTITNTGNATGATPVTYDLIRETMSVAVVDTDHGYGDQVVSALNATLSDRHTISLIDDEDAIDAVEAHDVVVIQDLDRRALDVQQLVDRLNTTTTGAIWLDSWGAYSDAIVERSVVTGDPLSTNDADTGQSPVNLTVTTDHPIVNSVVATNEAVAIHHGPYADRSWFHGFDGRTIGTVGADGSHLGGPAVAVDSDSATVLAATFGREYFVQNPSFTRAADQILANAVRWVGDHTPASTPAASNTTQRLSLTPGESKQLTFSSAIPYRLDRTEQWFYSVQTRDDRNRTPVTVQMPTGRVSGTVTDNTTNTPVSNVTVRINTTNGSTTAITNADGEYTLAAVPVGDHQLGVDTDRYHGQNRTVRVSHNETTTADLSVSPANGTITGSVVAADTGAPLKNVTVTSTDSDDTTQRVTTNGSGQYSMAVSPGNYLVSIGQTPAGFHSQSVVTVGPGETVSGVDFRLPPKSGTIVGYVLNGAGEPIEGATVTDADANAFETTTNESGYYEFDGLDRGTYAVVANASDYNATSIQFPVVSPNETTTQNFTMGAYFGVSNLSAPERAATNETITVSATITNTGSETATRSVFYLPPGTAFDASSTNMTTERRVTLAGGEQTRVTFTIPVPSSLEPGSYHHGISADEVSARTITIDSPTETPTASFEIVNASAPSSTPSGEPFAVGVTVENNGTSPGSTPVTVRRNNETQTITTNTLAPGERQTVSHTVRAPNETGPATYELSTHNDSVELTVTVEATGSSPAYFAVSNVTAPDQVPIGSQLRVNATVVNTGGNATTQSIYCFVERSRNGTGDTVRRSRAHKQLNLTPGESERLSFSTQVETTDDPGEYVVVVTSLQETATRPLTVSRPADTPNQSQKSVNTW
ncbi:S8 family serine peptidase [Halocatena halophila]|uniref:S8 family serine peptidase n=1 Tax=Halocatena halophila TaxID=2814576 RepID=UPI002ED52AAA